MREVRRRKVFEIISGEYFLFWVFAESSALNRSFLTIIFFLFFYFSKTISIN
jgi:hypothetical protein